MKNRQIVFTAPGKAELLEYDIPDELKPGEVRVKTKYTAISSGTERANLVGEVNISGVRRLCNGNFPRKVGYCGVGTVVETGSAVREVRPGQRVIIYFGKHCEYNVIPEEKAVPITPESLTDEEAALMVIGCFPENAIRKTRLELGESGVDLVYGNALYPVLGAFFKSLHVLVGAEGGRGLRILSVEGASCDVVENGLRALGGEDVSAADLVVHLADDELAVTNEPLGVVEDLSSSHTETEAYRKAFGFLVGSGEGSLGICADVNVSILPLVSQSLKSGGHFAACPYAVIIDFAHVFLLPPLNL